MNIDKDKIFNKEDYDFIDTNIVNIIKIIPIKINASRLNAFCGKKYLSSGKGFGQKLFYSMYIEFETRYIENVDDDPKSKIIKLNYSELRTLYFKYNNKIDAINFIQFIYNLPFANDLLTNVVTQTIKIDLTKKTDMNY